LGIRGSESQRSVCKLPGQRIGSVHLAEKLCSWAFGEGKALFDAERPASRTLVLPVGRGGWCCMFMACLSRV
jgi:hypothetical protein